MKLQLADLSKCHAGINRLSLGCLETMCVAMTSGGDNEVQRTMLEIVNQLDGFDSRGNIKVLMATNRPDTLDPALLRPGRLDRKAGFDNDSHSQCACASLYMSNNMIAFCMLAMYKVRWTLT